MIISQIKEIINQNISDVFLAGSSEEGVIAEYENSLNVSFSDKYRWFLKTYGSGVMLSLRISGISDHVSDSTKIDTENARKYLNIPSDFYIIEKCDEFYYCGRSRDKKIYLWDPHGETYIEADDFYIFLLSRLEDALEFKCQYELEDN